MNLRFAGCRENGRLYFGKATVNWQNALLHMRFAKAGDAKFSAMHANSGDPPLQARQNLLAKQWLQFARRAGQQHNRTAGVFWPQTRRRPARVLENFRSFWHHGLPHIYFGHFATQAAETPFDVAQDGIVAAQLAAEQVSDSLSREIVLGRPQSTTGNNQWHAIERIAKSLGQQIAIVTDHSLAQHFNANGIQLLGKEERVSVQAVRRKQLRTNRDDFSFHSLIIRRVARSAHPSP